MRRIPFSHKRQERAQAGMSGHASPPRAPGRVFLNFQRMKAVPAGLARYLRGVDVKVLSATRLRNDVFIAVLRGASFQRAAGHSRDR